MTTIEKPGTTAGTDSAAGSAPAAGTQRYLTFTLGGELYALDIGRITEIIEFRTLTKVPMMPAFIRGVINLRGRVLPVIDLTARFGHGTTAVARRTSIVVVELSTSGALDLGGETGGATGREIGVMVDTVNKVVHLGAEDIEPRPEFGSGIRAEFIAGMARLADEFIVVLDIERVLCLDEITAPAGDPQTLEPGAAATA